MLTSISYCPGIAEDFWVIVRADLGSQRNVMSFHTTGFHCLTKFHSQKNMLLFATTDLLIAFGNRFKSVQKTELSKELQKEIIEDKGG